MSKSLTMGNGQILSPPEKKEILFQGQMLSLLFLLEIDPRHFYAYWEVSPEELSIIGKQLGDLLQEAQLTLRVYEGEGPHDVQSIPHVDIPVERWKNDWYVEVSRSNTPYYAELGLKTVSLGEFYLIRRSNAIKTPKDAVSFSQPEQWMEVFGEYERVVLISSEEFISRQTSSTQPPISRKMVEEYYLNLSQNCMQKAVEQEGKQIPVWPAVIQGKESGGGDPASENTASVFPEMNAHHPASPQGRGEVVMDTVMAREKDAAAEGFGSAFNVSSLAIRSQLPGSLSSYTSGSLSSYSSASLSSYSNASLSSYSSGRLSSYSSASLSSYSSGSLSSGQREENKSSEEISQEELFHYDLDMVIYGKAHQGTILYIGEESVEVRPDGTFSWRLNLGQGGPLRIPVRAVLPGGKEICESIPLWFRRIKRS